MLRAFESKYSDEDYRLIRMNQLGAPLGIYRLKTSYIQKVRLISLLVLIIGLVILIVAFMISFIQWYSEQTGTYFEFLIFSPFPLSSWLAGLSGLIGGLLGLYVEVPRVQNEHLIVCERGMLHVLKRFKRDHIEVLHWKDILTIKRAFLVREYLIISREGKMFSLSISYQNFEGLISLIRQQSGLA